MSATVTPITVPTTLSRRRAAAPRRAVARSGEGAGGVPTVEVSAIVGVEPTPHPAEPLTVPFRPDVNP